MKKPALIAIISVSAALLVFLSGIFIGRSSAISLPAASPASVVTTTQGSNNDRLNINTANILQLQELPGIGEVLAQNIVDYRDSIGGFSSLYQLLEVDGIGNTKLNNILELICLED